MKKLTFTILFLILALGAIAQPPPPPPEPIPIDGGLGALIAGGLALAAKKMFSKNSKK